MQMMLICLLAATNVHQCFPKLKPKDIQFTVTEEEKKQNKSTFKTLELKNYDFILKSKTLKPTDRWSKQLAVD